MAWFRRTKPQEKAPRALHFDLPLSAFGFKSLFEKQRVGITGLEPFPRADKGKLFRWSRESDLAYACISKIVEAAQDPDLIVERRKNTSAPWAPESGHKLRQLMMRPNPEMTQADFFGCWLASEEVCGEFFAEIERDKRGHALALWPLDPTCMIPAEVAYPRAGLEGWFWRVGGEEAHLEPKDVLHSLRRDPQRPWEPLAPLRVALGSIEADAMQTAFVRTFFRGGGVPAGVIKIKGQSLSDEQALGIGRKWLRRFGYGGELSGAPPVFDENGDYEKIGSDLREIEGEGLRSQSETRICGIFGVPPLLVSALAGLKYVNSRSSAAEAQKEFWANKMSPAFKRMRSLLTWSLLLEFEDEADVRAELIRLNWDMAQVIALQESMSERSMRAREDFRVGGLTLNEFRSILGLAPIPNGDYYLRRANQLPITPEVVEQQLAAAASVTEQAVSVALTGARDPHALEETDVEKSMRRDWPRSLAEEMGEKANRWQRYFGGNEDSCGHKNAKAYDWDGVECWREPTEIERKVNLRSVIVAFDFGRDAISGQFYLLRGQLIEQAVAAVAKLKPGHFHELILEWPTAATLALRETLSGLFYEGQRLAKREMLAQRDLPAELAARIETDEQLLDRVSLLGVSRILNEIQARAAAAAAQFGLLAAAAFIAAVRKRLEGQSISFLEVAASQSSIAAVSAGRNREFLTGFEGDELKGEAVGYWVYSWVNLAEFGKGGPPCDVCMELETRSLNCDALRRDVWPDVPNPDCAGGYGKCRCMIWKQWWEGFPPRPCE